MYSHSKLFTLSASALLLALTAAQNTTTQNSTEPARSCDESDLGFQAGFNASGSFAVPGPRINDTFPNSTFTWTGYLADAPNNYTPGAGRTVWTVGLKTDPPQNLSDLNLPYTGCIIYLGDLPASVTGKTDDGSCSSTLSKKCIASLIQNINSSASAVSLLSSKNQPDQYSSSYPCAELSGSFTSSGCEKEFGFSYSAPFLAPNFTTPVVPRNNCTSVNPGDSDATNRAFPDIEYQYGSTVLPFDNFTYYDQAIRTPQPVITTYWLKGGSEDQSSGGAYGAAWADTKLFCINTNNAQPGSRTLEDAKKASAPGRMGARLLALVGLSILWQVMF